MDNNEFKFDEFSSSGKTPESEPKKEKFDFSMFMSKSETEETETVSAPAGEDRVFDDIVSSGTKPAEEEPSLLLSGDEITLASDEKGNLDDSNLSEDFVIGKDFFIDSTEVDEMVETEPKEKQPVKKKKRKKKASTGKSCLFAIIWMAAIFIISISAATAVLYLGMDYLGVGFDNNSTAEVVIVVGEGDGAKEIAEKLKEAGLIKSPQFFRLYVKYGGYDVKFQHGIYYFTKQDSYEDIAEGLCRQGVIATSAKVTIPEGYDIDEIAIRLEEHKICTADQFKAAVNNIDSSKYDVSFLDELPSQEDGVHYILEGFLFPDTYELYCTNDKSGAEQAIKKMLENMDRKFTAAMRQRAKDMGYTMNEILTIASVIEMEASVADYYDKQKVSAVFHNRLKSKEIPRLESDPTTKYPYNTDFYDTYKVEGLAPGSYCAPSIDSIKAALYPDEESDGYYFFVTDKDMNFYFNKTLKDHNKTIASLKKQGLWVTGQ